MSGMLVFGLIGVGVVGILLGVTISSFIWDAWRDENRDRANKARTEVVNLLAKLRSLRSAYLAEVGPERVQPCGRCADRCEAEDPECKATWERIAREDAARLTAAARVAK